MSALTAESIDFRPRLTAMGGISSGHAQVIRRHSRATVLRALLREKAASRADLARLTGLTRPTISDVVRELLSDGVIIETGHTTLTRPGKPAMLLTIDPHAAQVIAVDVSQAGNVSAALIAPDGSIQHRLAPVTTIGGVDAAEHAAAIVAALAAETPFPILGVGVAVQLSPSPDPASRLPSPDDLRARIAAVVDAPVHVASDAELSAHAEQRFGDAEAFLLVHLGMRIGTAIHGISHRSSGARELAHTATGSGGNLDEVCRCGQSECVHAWAALPALTRRLDAASSADERQRIQQDAGSRLGASLAVIVSALDFQTVVLSGAEGIVSDAFIEAMDAALTSAGHAMFEQSPVQVRRGIGGDAVLLGAAARVVAAELDMH